MSYDWAEALGAEHARQHQSAIESVDKANAVKTQAREVFDRQYLTLLGSLHTELAAIADHYNRHEPPTRALVTFAGDVITIEREGEPMIIAVDRPNRKFDMSCKRGAGRRSEAMHFATRESKNGGLEFDNDKTVMDVATQLMKSFLSPGQ